MFKKTEGLRCPAGLLYFPDYFFFFAAFFLPVFFFGAAFFAAPFFFGAAFFLAADFFFADFFFAAIVTPPRLGTMYRA